MKGKTIECNKCGGDLDIKEGGVNSVYCSFCGSQNLLTDVLEIPGITLLCLKCKRKNENSNRYCVQCKNQLQEECIVCHNYHPISSTIYCPIKGVNIKDSIRAKADELAKKQADELEKALKELKDKPRVKVAVEEEIIKKASTRVKLIIEAWDGIFDLFQEEVKKADLKISLPGKLSEDHKISALKKLEQANISEISLIERIALDTYKELLNTARKTLEAETHVKKVNINKIQQKINISQNFKFITVIGIYPFLLFLLISLAISTPMLLVLVIGLATQLLEGKLFSESTIYNLMSLCRDHRVYVCFCLLLLILSVILPLLAIFSLVIDGGKIKVLKKELIQPKNQLEKIENALKRINQVGSDPIDFWYKEGNYLSKEGNYEKALLYFDKIVCSEHKENVISSKANIWYLKGNALSKEKKYQEAIECFNNTLKLNSKHADALYSKGTMLYVLKEFEKALQCFNEALKINPYNMDIQISKGNTLCNIGKTLYDQEKYQEAIEIFDDAVKFNPDLMEAKKYIKEALKKFLKKN